MKPYKILAGILLALFAVSFIYSVIGIILSANGGMGIFMRSNIDYIKISLQCILGSFLLFLPSALEHKFKITFSSGIHIFYILFLYGAILLGAVQGYYKKFYHWDTILHTLSGGMLSSFGFCIIDIVNKSERMNSRLSDGLISFFAFCFAVMLDTIWEIIEFIMDMLMDLNMQQYINPDGTILVGHYAIVDTMKDLIVDVIGALFISIIGYILLKRRRLKRSADCHVQKDNRPVR
jgi:uncharacterized membrane protein YjdF